MASFNSPVSIIGANAEKVYARYSNLENLSTLLANIPADQIPSDKRDMLDNIKVEKDSISLPAGPVGAIRLVMAERIEPTLIRLQGEGAPVPLSLSLLAFSQLSLKGWKSVMAFCLLSHFSSSLEL